MPVEEGEQPEFASYDPSSVRPDITDPSQSSAAPGEAGSLPGANAQDLPGFDEKYSEDLDGLIYLGALTKRFTWLGHEFVVRTLTIEDRLATAQLMKPYMGTVGESITFSIATVALCIVTVDGKHLPTPIKVEKEDIAWAHQRFDYVKRNWFLTTVDIVFNEYLVLEAKAREVLDEMGKASGWAPSILASNEDFVSLIEEASSPVPG